MSAFDPRVELAEERRKFQAETLTTSWLSRRLATALGKAVLCDRCQRNKGEGVAVNGDDREWVCRWCWRGETLPAEPVHFHLATGAES